LTAGRVLRLDYADAAGRVTARDVEPLGFLGGEEHWYLAAWCRLRDAPRGFRLDRVRAVTALGERVPDRAVDLAALDTLGSDVVPLGDLRA
ncbi:helix-turn-helix transcriptional regulator, partial [Streptomyces sp. AF1A]|uniref:helix-turn-helix transcriptional regulator n=1 Tax=Streptomyces sp. AF1A TaxID=3394350 RepID=UPI0039BD2085